MVLAELFKEVVFEYRKRWWKSRRERHWTENLFFIPLALAVVVFMVIVFQLFIFPAEPVMEL